MINFTGKKQHLSPIRSIFWKNEEFYVGSNYATSTVFVLYLSRNFCSDRLAPYTAKFQQSPHDVVLHDELEVDFGLGTYLQPNCLSTDIILCYLCPCAQNPDASGKRKLLPSCSLGRAHSEMVTNCLHTEFSICSHFGINDAVSHNSRSGMNTEITSCITNC